jgi:hypothetical protein
MPTLNRIHFTAMLAGALGAATATARAQDVKTELRTVGYLNEITVDEVISYMVRAGANIHPDGVDEIPRRTLIDGGSGKTIDIDSDMASLTPGYTYFLESTTELYCPYNQSSVVDVSKWVLTRVGEDVRVRVQPPQLSEKGVTSNPAINLYQTGLPPVQDYLYADWIEGERRLLGFGNGVVSEKPVHPLLIRQASIGPCEAWVSVTGFAVQTAKGEDPNTQLILDGMKLSPGNVWGIHRLMETIGGAVAAFAGPEAVPLGVFIGNVVSRELEPLLQYASGELTKGDRMLLNEVTKKALNRNAPTRVFPIPRFAPLSKGTVKWRTGDFTIGYSDFNDFGSYELEMLFLSKPIAGPTQTGMKEIAEERYACVGLAECFERGDFPWEEALASCAEDEECATARAYEDEMASILMAEREAALAQEEAEELAAYEAYLAMLAELGLTEPTAEEATEAELGEKTCDPELEECVIE